MKSSYGQKKDNVNSTKITHFNNGKQKDTILKHAKLRDKKEEDKQEEVSDQEDDDAETQNKVIIGNYVFLIDQGHFAMIKSKIDENLYECIIKKSKTEHEESMLFLAPLGQEDEVEGDITKWTN